MSSSSSSSRTTKATTNTSSIKRGLSGRSLISTNLSSSNHEKRSRTTGASASLKRISESTEDNFLKLKVDRESFLDQHNQRQEEKEKQRSFRRSSILQSLEAFGDEDDYLEALCGATKGKEQGQGQEQESPSPSQTSSDPLVESSSEHRRSKHTKPHESSHKSATVVSDDDQESLSSSPSRESKHSKVRRSSHSRKSPTRESDEESLSTARSSKHTKVRGSSHKTDSSHKTGSSKKKSDDDSESLSVSRSSKHRTTRESSSHKSTTSRKHATDADDAQSLSSSHRGSKHGKARGASSSSSSSSHSKSSKLRSSSHSRSLDDISSHDEESSSELEYSNGCVKPRQPYLRRGSVTIYKLDPSVHEMQPNSRTAASLDDCLEEDYDEFASDCYETGEDSERKRRYLRRGSVTKYILDPSVEGMQPTCVAEDTYNLPRHPLPPPPANTSHRDLMKESALSEASDKKKKKKKSSKSKAPKLELKKPPRHVEFGMVTIYQHGFVLGDNPAVSEGAPLTLDTHCHEVTEMEVSVFETFFRPRKPRRTRRELAISVPHRARM